MVSLSTCRQEAEILRPAFSTFAAISRSHPPSSRIPGRQALAAVLSAVALLDKGLRLAARHPLPYWWDPLDEADRSDEEVEQPWALCYTLSLAAGRWLRQKLPARPGGQEPAPLISLAEEGALLETFKSLLGLLATQVCGTTVVSLIMTIVLRQNPAKWWCKLQCLVASL